MCRFCHILLLLCTRGEISVQNLHIGFLSVHCIQRRKRAWIFWHVPLTIITENSHGNISTLLGLCHSAWVTQAARQKSILEQFIPILSRPIISNRLSPGSCQRDVLFWFIWNYVYCIINCITVCSVLRPIKDSNISIEYKPRLTNLWMRNRPRAVAEVRRASFGTGE